MVVVLIESVKLAGGVASDLAGVVASDLVGVDELELDRLEDDTPASEEIGSYKGMFASSAGEAGIKMETSICQFGFVKTISIVLVCLEGCFKSSSMSSKLLSSFRLARFGRFKIFY